MHREIQSSPTLGNEEPILICQLTWMVWLVVMHNKHILSRVRNLPTNINHGVSMVQIDKTCVIVIHSWQNFGQPHFIAILKLYLQQKECTDFENSQITADSHQQKII
jgi:ribosomal protein S24E